MKEKYKIINQINDIIEFFKKNKNLTSYKNNFNLNHMNKSSANNYFYLGFTRSKKYSDCLEFKISNTYHEFVFEEVEYKDILKIIILTLEKLENKI